MNRFKFNALLLSMLVLSSAGVNAADLSPDQSQGPYVGASLAHTWFGVKDLGLPKTDSDETSLSGLAYAGYRFTDRLGVEAGYARFGSVKETVTVGGAGVEQRGSARSLYVAATGRLPITQDVALTGKAGISFGKVNGGDAAAGPADIGGAKRSFMYGVGAEYQVTPQLALTAEFDHFGRVSDKVSANMLSTGVRYSF